MSKQRERDSFHKDSEARLEPLPFLLDGKLTEENPSHYSFPPRASLVGDVKCGGLGLKTVKTNCKIQA